MNRQILVIHSDKNLCQKIQDAMQDNHTEVICTMSEMNAMDILVQSECHMVIMGLLPSADETMKIVHHIRRAKAAPIIMIIADIEISDKILLFHAGVNVFWEPPFDMTVFAAQANSLIQLYEKAQAENRKDQPIVFGTELMIDPIYRQVIIEGETLSLTRTEYELLLCLATHQCQIWSYSQLYRHVWNDTLGVEGDNTVKTHIGNLKKKLANYGKHYIQNSRGIGYRFMPPNCDEKNRKI